MPDAGRHVHDGFLWRSRGSGPSRIYALEDGDELALLRDSPGIVERRRGSSLWHCSARVSETETRTDRFLDLEEAMSWVVDQLAMHGRIPEAARTPGPG